MVRTRMVVGRTERQQLVGGAITLLLATICLMIMATTGIGGDLGGMTLGLASVLLFVVGTLSIGTSEQNQI